MFSANVLLEHEKVAIINEYHEEKADERCNKCGSGLYAVCYKKLVDEKASLLAQIEKLLAAVPVISLQVPLNWDYQVRGLVTGQSTTGTGVISDFTSSFTDFFGTQSNAYNSKLKSGENLCISMLRKQALDRGGNAVIGVDIDYSEVGGGKGMLMVCMAGTAILLNNPEILGEEVVQTLSRASEVNARLRHLNRHYIPTF